MMLIFRLRVAAVAATLVLLAGALPLEAHAPSLDAEAMVRASRQIVVAVVTGKTVRWNEGHRLIVTDYQLAVEDTLKGSVSRVVRLRMPGGSLDGVEDRSCGTVPLEVGARYLLFIEDVERNLVSPLVGAAMGAFREETGDGRETRVRSAARAEAVDDAAGTPVSFGDFVERTKRFVDDVESRSDTRAEALAKTSGGDSSGATKLPRKRHDPGGAAQHLAAHQNAARVAPVRGQEAAVPSVPDLPLVVESEPGLLRATPAWDASAPSATGGITPLFYYTDTAARYITFNQLPSSMTPWAPRDQYMMSEWNRLGDVFRVSQSPTDTWAWGDNVFDIAGWTSDAEMVAAFGSGWGTFTGMCKTRTQNGRVIEADICLNEAYSWTADTEVGTRTEDSPEPFDQTMLHELGHAWGLWHPWEKQNVWWDSVMNYMPQILRLPILRGDDASAIRSAYPGISLHDGLLTSYTTSDDAGSWNPIYNSVNVSPASVAQGGTFSFTGPIKLENMGTDSIVNPAVDIYLTTARLSWTGPYYYLLTNNFSSTVGPGNTLYLNLTSATAPAWLPPGKYYLGFYYRDGADSYGANNSGWSDADKRLGVWQASPVSIIPTTSWQTSYGSGEIGPEGTFFFRFPVLYGARYDFSLCAADGGSGSFDTVIQVIDSNDNTTTSDDACGWQSRISGWTPPSTGTATLAVRGYSPSTWGTFRVAYKRTCSTISLTPWVAPPGTAGTAYSTTFAGSNGAAPYTYGVVSGTLPPGLTLNASTGTLSGTPTLAGSYTFSVAATDSYGCAGTAQYTITVACAGIAVGPSTLASGTLGSAYSQTLSASGGTAPYTYAVTAGTLPSGLSLASNGTLSGTPSATGSFTFTVRATDAAGCSASRQYTVSIACAAIAVSPSTLPNASYGAAYSQTLTASGGVAPYTFVVGSGALPNGLSLSASGVLSGTPSLVGTFSFTVTATASNGCAGSRSYSVSVTCPKGAGSCRK